MIKNIAPPTGIPKHCPKCKLLLVKRTGRFGEFMCCPASRKGDNHGTWMLKPKRPTAPPHDSGLGYAHKRPDPEPEADGNPVDRDWTMRYRWATGQAKSVAEIADDRAYNYHRRCHMTDCGHSQDAPF